MPHPSVVRSEERGGFECTELRTNLDELMVVLGWLCVDRAPGVWVASTDMLLTHTDRDSELGLADSATS